ncbi:hypothetical protein D3C71_522780 [compost metagenome]
MHGLGAAHDPQQFGVGRDLGQTGHGDAAKGGRRRRVRRQGRGLRATGTAAYPFGQPPAALGLAFEDRDDGQVARQPPGQAEQGDGLAGFQLQLQFIDGFAFVARRQLARVEGDLDPGALPVDHADTAHHCRGEARRQVAAALQQLVGGRRLERGAVQRLGGDGNLPLVASGLAGGGLALQGLDEAVRRGPHPQSAPGRAQEAIGGVEIDRAQRLAGLGALQRRVARQAHDRARPEAELQLGFGCGRGHGGSLGLSPSSRKRRSCYPGPQEAQVACGAVPALRLAKRGWAGRTASFFRHPPTSGARSGDPAAPKAIFTAGAARGSVALTGAAGSPGLRRCAACRRMTEERTQPRATWKPAKDWLTGISSSALMFRCAGRVATQNRVSAMSSPVIGWAPP